MIIPGRFFLLSQFFLLFALGFPLVGEAAPRVVIYAAHGGEDTGAGGNGQEEKVWNLRVAQSLQKSLASGGYDVVMVRVKDESLPLDQWVNAVNVSGASVALIIHADREWTGRMRGPFAVVEPPTGSSAGEGSEIQRWGNIPNVQFRQSLRLAKVLAQAWGVSPQLSPLSDSRALPGELTSSEGRVLASPHQSLRYLAIPSVVIEPLFLTSSQDLKTFLTDEGMQGFIGKTVKGLQAYFQSAP
jgi:N-acetylmuramoyl-L-alanine amidase